MTQPNHTGVRTFYLVQWLTGPIECERMDDLPAQMQDAILRALEAKSKEVELPLAITGVMCDKDHDNTDPSKTWFLRVEASEIVVVDERELARLRFEANALLGIKGTLQ